MIKRFDEILKRFLIGKLHILFLEPIWDQFIQILKFVIGGGFSAIITYIIYTISLLGIRYINVIENYDYIVAQLLAFIISVLWSFVWNNWIVFEGKKADKKFMLKTLVKTYILYSFTSLFLSSILLYFWIQIVKISEFVSPIINIIICVPLNFVLNKFWAFKKEKL